MKFTVLRTLILIAASLCHHVQADTGWHKLTRENCAQLLDHLRAKPLTVENIIAELDGKSLGLVKDCGPGCWEFADWSSKSIPVSQAENEHKVAAAYAESLLSKNEGLFLFSRFNGFDIPAWDGLTFELNTGAITSKVSFKRGTDSRKALEQAFEKAHRYSLEGGAWAVLPVNMATKYPPRGLSWEEARVYATENYDKIARWMLVEDERIRTRVVFQQPDHREIREGLPAFARRLLLRQPGREVESVTIIDGKIHHHIVD